jgi:CheY-like chemotaxis protein
VGLDPSLRINLERSVVLLVDDNPQALEALSGMIRGFGVRKQFKSKSGAEAMHIVKTQELDLVIIDSAMPDMDGYDFVRWLRREAPPEVMFTPVIMVTGHAARSLVEKSRDSGANFVLTKPFTLGGQGRAPDRQGRGLCRPRPPLQEHGAAARHEGAPPRRPFRAHRRSQGPEYGPVGHRHVYETIPGAAVSQPEFIKVKYRLSEQVAKPGGMTADIANQRALRELAAQAGDARKTLGATIGRMEVICQEKAVAIDAIYEESSTVLDIAGLFNQRILCDAAYSLCELSDRLRTAGRQEWDAISVHVNALRLIWSKDQAVGAEMKAVVDGLWALTDRLTPS